MSNDQSPARQSVGDRWVRQCLISYFFSPLLLYLLIDYYFLFYDLI